MIVEARHLSFSVDVGVAFGPLNIEKPGQAIQSTWSVVGRDLVWRSAAFVNVEVIFCDGGNEVIAYYNQQPPQDCTRIQITGLDSQSLSSSR